VNAVQAPKRVMQGIEGRPTLMGKYERTEPSDLPGYWRRHAGKGDQMQHRKPQR